MKAMVLAAGLGTRLRPLTNDRPKALVEIAGRTLLEITLCRLRTFGVNEVIINVHHFAELVLDYLKTHDNFGMRLEISREGRLLDTGGGLKKAAHFFLEEGRDADEPFIVHNVDVMSNIDLGRMVQFHKAHQALATLAMHDRKTSRHLLFDGAYLLCGRQSVAEGKTELIPAAQPAHALAFSGIHVIAPQLLRRIEEDDVFSIIACYLRLAAQGEKILGFRADEYYWRDLGKLESLLQAEEDLKRKAVLQ
jgi:NDP-sugar pyrophosphorylase family protein